MKTFSKPITEIIRLRYSCRTYLERPIERDIQLQLVEYAAALGSGPFGGKARFELIAAEEDDRKDLRQLGTYGFIKGATGFLVGATQDGEEKLEDFGRVELGLRSLQYSPEKLQEMARDAFLNGKKLYEEREIAYGNLASAIKSFNEAELYLETVDPKPDFYAEILTARKDCQQELEQRFNNEDFLAERAIKLKAWEEAARALRVILDMIPDRDDPRNVESRKKLLEVENRLKKPR